MAKEAKKSYLHFRPFLWVNYVFIVLLLLTNLTPYVAPDIFWPFVLLSFSMPIIVLVNLLFFLMWLVLLKRYVYYSLLALILSYSIILNHVQFHFSDDKQVNETALRLLSYNVRNLSNNNIHRSNKEIRAQIQGFVAAQKVDIVCFQEFQTYPKQHINTLNSFKEGLHLPYSHSAPYLKKNKFDFLDLFALFSDVPIENSHDFYMDGKCYGFYVDVRLDGMMTRVFNLHLESNHFNQLDYQIFTEAENTFNEKNRNHIVWLLQKLKKYGVKRSYQARSIRKEIEKSPYPVIVAGDFNDTPASYTYNHIANKLKDAFIEKGSGYGNTYNGSLPPMRIDYMLFDRKFEVLGFETLKPDLSDHFPQITQFSIQK